MDVQSDRIVEIALVRVTADNIRQKLVHRVKPPCSIPAEATAVHGITDEDVADCPPFSQIAERVLLFLGNSDLAGFNLLGFDVHLLMRELERCNLKLTVNGRNLLDPMRIYHRMEPRNLEAGVKFYLGRDHDGAHSAAADVDATIEVLYAQMARYEDLPNDLSELDEFCRGDAVDLMGKFVRGDEGPVFAFGKYQGKPLAHVAKTDRDYLHWAIHKATFPPDTRELMLAAYNEARYGPVPF